MSARTLTQDCPCCGYKRAFSMTVKNGRELFFCHAGCSRDDLLAAIGGRNLLPVSPRMEAPRRINRDTQNYIWQLWRESQAATGTPVEVYLAARGLTGPIPPALRFLPDHPHRPSGTRQPCMIAVVTDCNGRVQAVHRTYLSRDGKGKAPVTPAKMTLGAVGGFSCHIAPAGEKLAVSEGIETGLSVQFATGLPTWAALSAGGVRQLILPPLPLASEVIIAADADPVGMQAAHNASARFGREGRTVRIAIPPSGQDFNDVLQGAA
jgi:putative DNA primase/helicase